MSLLLRVCQQPEKGKRIECPSVNSLVGRTHPAFYAPALKPKGLKPTHYIYRLTLDVSFLRSGLI
jgi:hypothetical protein